MYRFTIGFGARFITADGDGSIMDEQTEHLRDVFLKATGKETVTERQEASPGSLVDRDEATVTDRIVAIVGTMRERGSFAAGLSTAAYGRVARGVFGGESDEAIAAALEAREEFDRRDGVDDVDETDEAFDAETVRRARLDLHLVRASDRETAAPYAALRQRLADDPDRSAETCAHRLDAPIEAVERALPVARADLASARVNDRFRDEFRSLLTDADLSESHAATAREDGLREATEDIETDVSL